jgi:hypothetical protein
LFNLGKVSSRPDIVWDTRFIEAAKDLQNNFGTPATGLSTNEFQKAVEVITMKHFGIPTNNLLMTGLFISSLGFGVLVYSTNKLDKK